MTSDEEAESIDEDQTGTGPDLTTADLKTHVLRLAFPGSMRMGLQSLIEMVSLMIVGSLGAEAIAAVGVGKRVVQLATAVLQALSVGATATVARSIGANDRARAQKVVSQVILFALIIGLCITLTGVTLAPTIMRGMMALQEEPDDEVVRLGSIYLRILSSSYVVAVVLFMSNALFQGAGDMKTPLLLMTYMNVVNVVCAYVLVHGLGPFPAMGVAGAGLAAALARGSAGLIALWILATGRSVISMDLRRIFTIDWNLLRTVVNIGIPAAIENFIRRGSQIMYTMIIAGMGTAAMAANSIAMSIQSLAFMPGFGFGLAATALVGQNLGAQQPDRAERSGYISAKFAVAISCLMSVLFAFAPQLVIHLYTDDAEVISLTVTCLRIIAVALPSLALIQVFSGGLRGAGDTRYVMFSTLLGNWGIRLLGSYLLGMRLGMGLAGVWIAMACDQIGRGFLLMVRFRRGQWKKIRLFFGGGHRPPRSHRHPGAAISHSATGSRPASAANHDNGLT
ncbi:MAG: MATE family efflux transporter [Bacillota bacterium]